jgi:hypothetical protein
LTKMLQEFESNKEISYWYLKKTNTVVQSNLSYVTFQGRWLLNTGLIKMKCTVKGN